MKPALGRQPTVGGSETGCAAPTSGGPKHKSEFSFLGNCPQFHFGGHGILNLEISFYIRLTANLLQALLIFHNATW